MDEIYVFLNSDIFSLLLRLSLSMLIGAMIGADRSKKGSPAGLKTHSLVCIGATLVMLTSEFCVNKYGVGDPTRMSAQVISGIGFLGAGTIIVTGKNQIKGLTSAAGIWFSACVGLAIGAGFYAGGILAAVFEIYFIKLLSQANYQKNTMIHEMYIEYNDNFSLTEAINIFKKYKSKLKSIDKDCFNIYDKSGVSNALFVIETIQSENLNDIISDIEKLDGVLTISDI